jgi:hypothetical protein
MTAARTPPTTAPRTLAADLEAHRIEHRARRLAFVVDALEERRAIYGRGGQVPRPLNDVIAEFSHRLGTDRRRLAELRGTRDPQETST